MWDSIYREYAPGLEGLEVKAKRWAPCQIDGWAEDNGKYDGLSSAPAYTRSRYDMKTWDGLSAVK